MQEPAHLVTGGGREAIANLSGLVQGVSSPPLRYQKLHLTRGSLNGPLSF